MKTLIISLFSLIFFSCHKDPNYSVNMFYDQKDFVVALNEILDELEDDYKPTTTTFYIDLPPFRSSVIKSVESRLKNKGYGLVYHDHYKTEYPELVYQFYDITDTHMILQIMISNDKTYSVKLKTRGSKLKVIGPVITRSYNE